MYTLMSAVRSVLKEFRLLKGLWDKIVQAVAYVKNYTISRSANGITPYKGVNKSVLSVAHLLALGCQYYVHVSDTNMRQTMYDRGWKGIMVGYGGVNQWRVYNPKTRRIHVSASVCSNKGFSYYDTSHEATDEDDESAELGDVWNEADDNEFGKVMAGKQVVGREATLADPTPQSKERSVVADSEEEGDNDSLPESTTDNNHLLPNQPMPPPAVPGEISFPLTDISGANPPCGQKHSRTQKKEKIFQNRQIPYKAIIPQINLEAQVSPAQNLEYLLKPLKPSGENGERALPLMKK